MTDILDISCKDMIVIHGNKNPKVLPFQIQNLKEQQKLFHMGIKKDGSIFVNKAHDSSVLTPATPDPKRHMHAFAGIYHFLFAFLIIIDHEFCTATSLLYNCRVIWQETQTVKTKQLSSL
ncbi:hypothetical protein R6Q59_014948 [Mikania micrantha]